MGNNIFNEHMQPREDEMSYFQNPGFLNQHTDSVKKERSYFQDPGILTRQTLLYRPPNEGKDSLLLSPEARLLSRLMEQNHLNRKTQSSPFLYPPQETQPNLLYPWRKYEGQENPLYNFESSHKLNLSLENISDISWNETAGLYPTKNTTNPSEEEKNNPAEWDSDKLEQLLKARAAITLIAEKRNSIVAKGTFVLDSKNKILALYHSKDNFPEVDDEIKNDTNVKFYCISHLSPVSTSAISSKYWNQKCVKTYGTFYNNGGGDARKGAVYIHFYKAIPK